MSIAENDAVNGNGNGFRVYKLARDARDLMMFDAVSRDTMRKLGAGNDDLIYDGVTITQAVISEIVAERKINAIKELRNTSGLGLKEAKDIVEAIWPRYHP
jgi:ribosomal protein L7/L12